MRIINIKTVLIGLAITTLFVFMGSERQGVSKADVLDIPSSEVPVVLELFTSQGCSSCPPADRIAEALTQKDNLYILSCHVTYWDYIGWEDTLGSSICDNRQRQYARHLNDSGRVYTPQLIINGEMDLVGSRGNKVVSAIIDKQKGSVGYIDLEYVDNALNVVFPDIEQNNRSYKVRVFLIKKSQITPIGRGENHDKTINYVQNVMDIYDVGEWRGDGGARTIPLPPSRIRVAKADQIIVLVNEGQFGPVRAVGRLNL